MVPILILAILAVSAIVAAGICYADSEFRPALTGKTEHHVIHNSFGTTTITIRRR